MVSWNFGVRENGKMERFMPWLPASWKHYGHAWVRVEEPMSPSGVHDLSCGWKPCWCPWSMWWHADMGKEVFLLLLFCFALFVCFCSGINDSESQVRMRNINGFWDNRSSLPLQKRSSLNRKLLTSVLKIAIKMLKGCFSQLMTSCDRVGRTQVSLRDTGSVTMV